MMMNQNLNFTFFLFISFLIATPIFGSVDTRTKKVITPCQKKNILALNLLFLQTIQAHTQHVTRY